MAACGGCPRVQDIACRFPPPAELASRAARDKRFSDATSTSHRAARLMTITYVGWYHMVLIQPPNRPLGAYWVLYSASATSNPCQVLCGISPLQCYVGVWQPALLRTGTTLASSEHARPPMTSRRTPSRCAVGPPPLAHKHHGMNRRGASSAASSPARTTDSYENMPLLAARHRRVEVLGR